MPAAVPAASVQAATPEQPGEATQDLHVLDVAHRAMTGMRRAGVSPTPRNYHLWYASLDGSSQESGPRLAGRPAAGTAAQPVLDALESECTGPELDMDALVDGSEAVQAAAQDALDGLSGNAPAMRAYGEMLAYWSARLRQDCTPDGLALAVSALTLGTTQAGERNRLLEHQLSEGAARIARLKESLVGLRQEATTDALTGLSNRKAFDARLRKAVAAGRRDARPVTLLMIDVDHFKRFNDQHGHQVGDLVLRLVGRMLSSNVKGRDTAARYGGEEFAVILAGATLQGGLVIAEQLRGALDGKRLLNKGSGRDLGHVTVSIGVAQLGAGEAGGNLVARADAALYRAKALGRNRVQAEASAV